MNKDRGRTFILEGLVLENLVFFSSPLLLFPPLFSFTFITFSFLLPLSVIHVALARIVYFEIVSEHMREIFGLTW